MARGVNRWIGQLSSEKEYLLATGQHEALVGLLGDALSVAEPKSREHYLILCWLEVARRDETRLAYVADEAAGEFPQQPMWHHMRSLHGRCLRNYSTKTMLLVNYKCGSTTANRAAKAQPDWYRDIDVSRSLARPVAEGFFDDWTIHLVARSPIERILSFYWNKLVDYRDEAGNSLGMDPLVRDEIAAIADVADFREFVEAGVSGRARPAMFEVFLGWIPQLLETEDHLWPQFSLYSDAGLVRDDVNVWPLVRLGDLFDSIGLADASVAAHNSSKSAYDHLRSGALQECVETLYPRDVAEFGSL